MVQRPLKFSGPVRAHASLFYFERFAIDLILASKNLKEAASLLCLSWDQVHHIQSRAVDRGLKSRKLTKMKNVGIDEKSFLKGHK